MEDKEPGWKRPKDWDKMKLYACSECDDTFVNKKSLETHLGTHTIKKKILYFCKRCDRRYTRKDNLKVHYTNHHPAGMQELDTLYPETEEERRAASSPGDVVDVPGDSPAPSGRKRKGTEVTSARPSKEPRKKEARPVDAPSGHQGMGLEVNSFSQQRVESWKRRECTEKTREPQKEEESAEETQLPLTPGRNLVIQQAAELSLSPASASLLEEASPRRRVVHGGKPRGMISMMKEAQEEGTDEEEVEDNDDAPLSINLGQALKGSTIRRRRPATTRFSTSSGC